MEARTAAADPLAVTVVQTDPLLGQRMAVLAPLAMTSAPASRTAPLITVNDRVGYQRVSGFGAAMTDSSAWLINNLPSATRAALETNLFSPAHLGLNLLRVPIGASDFTVGGTPYSYDDLPPHRTDPALAHFSIAHDQAYILPVLRAIRGIDPDLRLLATPWTAPAWMKGNDSLGNLHNGGTLLGQDWYTWARYIVRFLQAYAAAGAPIAALTAQNEPGNPTSYPGMNLASWAEAKWIAHDLDPALARAHLHPQVFSGDLGWASGPYARALVDDERPGQVAGLSWHCYFGSPDVMSEIRALRPSLQTIVSECSPGISAIPIPEVLISSLRDWASEVALWNVALEPSGGPVQQPNTGCRGCFGLVAVNPATGRVSYNLPYYDLGQASTFVEPGAVRVSSNAFVSYDYSRPGVNFVSAGIDDVALVNPDGSRVLLLYNNATAAQPVTVAWHGHYFSDTVPPQAMVSFAWNRRPYTLPGATAPPAG
jgi:glucosylceramidase